ncbi:MAG: hypothetical protein KDM91_15535 [Verrucomicrobiae bacterium]|nr:hypothetical protein [Verrucomicrobiae bacterium]
MPSPQNPNRSGGAGEALARSLAARFVTNTGNSPPLGTPSRPCRGLLIAVAVAFTTALPTLRAQLPAEPLAIEPGVPQFVFDNHVVDNLWAIRYKSQVVRRVFHQPVKRPENPLAGFAEDNPSYVAVVRDEIDEATGQARFRMYYQANVLVRGTGEKLDDPNQETLPDAKNPAAAKGRAYRTEIGYAESPDGLHWTRPALDLFPEKSGGAPNNYVIGLPGRPEIEACAPIVVENVPEADRRGFKTLLLYRAKGKGAGDIAGIRLAGTRDGIHFEDDTAIAHLHSDHHNAVCYDPVARNYVMFCRAKQIYRAFGTEMIDTGASRRVASLRSPELWGDWLAHDQPRTLLVPDEKDAETMRTFFYGMPTVYRHGIFWGFLEPFRMNDYIHTEVATSRDGATWLRLPDRPKLVEFGPEGAWDDTMIFGSPAWVPVGDEWWFYYTGWDGPHGGTDRAGGVGVATCKRERLIGQQGPPGGGVLCTRTLTWPGGDLWLNVAPVGEDDDPAKSKVTVRVSDVGRKVLEGFDHPDCAPLAGSADETRQVMTWQGGKGMSDLKGQVIRLEFYLENAELFAFGVGGE